MSSPLYTVAAVALLIGVHTALPATESSLVNEARDVLVHHYVDEAKVREPALRAAAAAALAGPARSSSDQDRAAIRAMVATLGDRYSRYLPPEPLHALETTLAGHFGGLGIQVRAGPAGLEVDSAFAGSPAARGGMRAGDRIAKVDGVDVRGLPAAAVIQKLRGAAGTPVRVAVSRAGQAAPVELPLVREEIDIPSVRTSQLEPGVGCVTIARFGETTATELMFALEALQVDHLDGLVLDLRDDPGGLLRAAIDVGHVLLGDLPIVEVRGRAPDEVVVSTITRRGETQPLVSLVGDAARGGLEVSGSPGLPRALKLAVLVNGQTASAAEIVAGAIRDHHRGTLVGQRTLGKGSVQTVIPLSDGSAISLTTAHYYTPGGICLDGSGLTPEVSVPSTSAQLARATALVRRAK